MGEIFRLSTQGGPNQQYSNPQGWETNKKHVGRCGLDTWLKSLVDTKCGQIRHQILQLISHPFVFPFQNNEVFSSCIFVVWKRPSLTQNHFTDPTKPCNDETVPMACPMVSRCRIARTIGHSPCCCRSPKRGVVPSQDVAVVDSPWQGLEGRKRLGRIEMASEGWS